jgi:hypothetical protein
MYSLDLTIESSISATEYIDSIVIINNGGKIIGRLCLETKIEVGSNSGKNIELTRHDERNNIQCGEKHPIVLLTTDRKGITIGDTTIFHENLTENKIIWDEKHYTGIVECSFDGRSIRKYLTLEKDEYSVRAYLHDY